FAAGAFADTMEVATTWSRLQDLHQSVRSALGRRTVVMAHFSHAYREGCSIYFSFAGRGRTDVYDKTWRDALAAARAAGGTVTHHHGVGTLKAVEAAREAGAAVRAWRTHKEQLDPSNLMNPGRLFPEEVEVDPGPPKPTTGPVFDLDPTSLLAEVDPDAEPSTIQEVLAAKGLQLRHLPDRSFGEWLRNLERGALPHWETPLFAVQARFADGTSARIGISPRSAAGPDLRWSLLRQAKPEIVQVPVRPLDEMVIKLDPEGPDLGDLRPCWTSGNVCGFHTAAEPLAQLAGETCTSDEQGARPPVAPHRSTKQ
ncbi:MAG: FAD-linked oxidase C-terminal domain-containing protein, partial [Myxococcota bacterium]|nr:FAD-linked oxidase C-terminal domain-containing protein [Myxococcota bacterium]